MGMGDDSQIHAMFDRVQKGPGVAPAHAASLIHLEVGATIVIAAIEFSDGGDAALCGSSSPGVKDLPAHASFFDPQFAARTMEFIGAVHIVLAALEPRQDLSPRPAG